MNGKVYAGLYPGVIGSYDAAARLVRVSIEGVTDGGDELPIAEINYPIGDKAKNTEIEILAGDLVWVAFMGGDARYPIIDGYRNPGSDNSVGVRRFHHANIALFADQALTLQGGSVAVTGPTSIDGNAEIDGDVAISGNLTVSGTISGQGWVID
ncbi:hypothetical protein [Methylovulum psychrotolerans]|uniref:Gp5/Type VI secretion system Vgr protein OB-fold domain-containing protein n=1 Tax=Methylovulum psychrotolerans TaxID=1704499 RepID=A0A1Z4BVD8_9GAMM|nr:hypothetical protein [Methylovulum psychrotolerans]ASF45213.1 hypothetical protein CEK71_03575 [Methylovulum psychrotolerans]